MNSSSLAQTISTNQLIESFSDVDLQTFKQGLFEHFNCENENEFLQKILIYCQSHVSSQTISNIYNAAINISIKSQYKAKASSHNGLSSLSSNVIQCVGGYLTISNCINLGYCNRNLYFETQKKSFVLDRRNKNDKMLLIDPKMLISIKNILKMTGFAFQYPFNVNFGVTTTQKNTKLLQKEKVIFQNTLKKHEGYLGTLLNNVKFIRINNHWSDLIPIDQLFGQWQHNSNGNKDTHVFCNRKNDFDIKFLTLYSHGCGLETFLNNLHNYHNSDHMCSEYSNTQSTHINSNAVDNTTVTAAKMTSLRMINNLIIQDATIRKPFVSLMQSRKVWESHVQAQSNKQQTLDRLQLFFGTLKGCYKNLHILRGRIEIDNFQLLSSIFHFNLTGITLGYPNINYQRVDEFTQGAIELTKQFVKKIQKYSHDRQTQLQQAKQIQKTSLVTDSNNTNIDIQIPTNFQQLDVCLYHSYKEWTIRDYIETLWNSMNQLSMFKYLEILSLYFSNKTTIHQCLNFDYGWLATTLTNQTYRNQSIPNLKKICISIKNDFFETVNVSVAHIAQQKVIPNTIGPRGIILDDNSNHGYPNKRDLSNQKLTTYSEDADYAAKRFYMTHLVLYYLSIMSKNGIFGKCKRNETNGDANTDNDNHDNYDNRNTSSSNRIATVEMNWIFECAKDRYISKATGRATDGRKCFLDCANYKSHQVAQTYTCQGCGFDGHDRKLKSNINNTTRTLGYVRQPGAGGRGSGGHRVRHGRGGCSRWIPTYASGNMNDVVGQDQNGDKLKQHYTHGQDEMVANSDGNNQRTIYTKCESTSFQDNYFTICDWIVDEIASQDKQKELANFVVRFKFDEH